jgi:hypothetical protein
MKINSTQVEKILKGNQSFSQLGFSMLITRLKASYAKDSSLNSLQNATIQVNGFLDKFKNIMAADYAVITKL